MYFCLGYLSKQTWYLVIWKFPSIKHQHHLETISIGFLLVSCVWNAQLYAVDNSMITFFWLQPDDSVCIGGWKKGGADHLRMATAVFPCLHWLFWTQSVNISPSAMVFIFVCLFFLRYALTTGAKKKKTFAICSTCLQTCLWSSEEHVRDLHLAPVVRNQTCWSCWSLGWSKLIEVIVTSLQYLIWCWVQKSYKIWHLLFFTSWICMGYIIMSRSILCL